MRTISRSFTAVALMLLATAAASCTTVYRSAYRPPVDGRARVVWDDDAGARIDYGGVTRTPDCEAAVAAIRDPEAYAPAFQPTAGYALAPPMVVRTYVPVYYGGHVLVGSGGFAPSFRTRGVRVPPAGGAHVATAPPPPRVVRGGSASSGRQRGGGSGGSGGQGGDKGGLVVVAAILVGLTLPVLDVGIAASMPEKRIGSLADEVNAFNDLARTPGSPCAYGYAVAVSPAATILEASP